MSNFYNSKCQKCEAYFATTDNNKACKCCLCDYDGNDLIFKKVTNPLDIIEWAENELEQNNRHDINAIDFWNSVSKFIPKNKKIKAAESLALFLSVL